jgi:post-segregation antitoxin (ccd killing protein)
MAERKTTSIKVDPELWKKAKIYCIKKEIDISALVEELLKKELSREK